MIRGLERTGAPPDQVEQAAQRALETGMLGAEAILEVLMAHLDYLRRRVVVGGKDAAAVEQLRSGFDYSEGLVVSMYPDWEAAAMNLGMYRARVEPDSDTARQVWERLVRGPLGRYSSLWLEYVRWCRGAKGKGVGEARGVLKRALMIRGLDYPESICEVWLTMEREVGSSLDDFEEALSRVTVAREKAMQAYMEYEQQQQQESHQENATKGKAGKKRPAPGTEAHPGEEEGGADNDDNNKGGGQQEERKPKKARVGAENGPPADPVEDAKRRVFVKHLCTTLTQDEVSEEMTRLFGPVKSVKLKIAKDGSSRGMADVVFATDEAAQAAVGKWMVGRLQSHYPLYKGTTSTVTLGGDDDVGLSIPSMFSYKFMYVMVMCVDRRITYGGAFQGQERATTGHHCLQLPVHLRQGPTTTTTTAAAQEREGGESSS